MYHLVTLGFIYLVVTRRTHRAAIWIIRPDSTSIEPVVKVDQHVRHFNPITLNCAGFLNIKVDLLQRSMALILPGLIRL